MHAQQYLDSLTAQGRISFTMEQIQYDLSLSPNAAACIIRRLKQKGSIASPAKGYYLILTPEYRSLGCLPPDLFIDDLMQYLRLEYYVALVSAALYHGAAHQQPQIFQVMIPKTHKNIQCGRAHIQFIRNQSINMGHYLKLKTRAGFMRVSTPEVTAMDLLNFMNQSGGLGQISTIIDELFEIIDHNKLLHLAFNSQQKQWVQRLGYILDTLGHHTLAQSLLHRLNQQKMRIIPLVPSRSMTNAVRDMKWRIAINAKIESDIQDDTA